MSLNYARHGFAAARPYIYSRLDTIELLKLAFEAEEIERHDVNGGFHVELRIGDSVVVLEAAEPPHPSGSAGSVYVYVPNVDASFARALSAGAAVILAPEDKPYQERAAGVRDAFGNAWWFSTFTG
jgi:PhnB protein